ncbi:hypothetical protein AVEN_22025-1 [Araneus ventricosus]|uniref:Uncharacterized protein n=1 Tax=Araneus ventricosus TaxID=182803 RepID=A0A4Y2J391_ARAVE|nr:hypothetical protein AVEN_22025-1 [Araneus ventricosus]
MTDAILEPLKIGELSRQRKLAQMEIMFAESFFLAVNFGATGYVDLNDWQACYMTSLPVLREICSHELLKMIQDDASMDGWNFTKFPSHSQAV